MTDSADKFFDIRVFFSKLGRAKYISHLDLYRTVQRAIKRAKLPVWETKGFNRHIYLTFALPLALGVEGLHESMDMRLVSDMSFDNVRENLNAALPEELTILSVARPVMKHTKIKKASYRIITDINTDNFKEFLNQEKIVTEKKTKKKITIVDLKPHIMEIRIESGKICLVLPAGVDFAINPGLVIESYKTFKPESWDSDFFVSRTEIFTGEGKRFE
ncbi:MAG: TIGR03936 family radical SAM-associated protein [Eubacterium sp.]|nr:TIGR03936 family radical SAM-associated protein [Eubacterium sp.]